MKTKPLEDLVRKHSGLGSAKNGKELGRELFERTEPMKSGELSMDL